METSKTICITGATAGIGEATARILSTKGHRLILIGRRADRLQNLATQLPCETHCITLDVRNRTAVMEAFQHLPDSWKTIDVLINNAGLAAGFGAVHEGNPDHWDTMIDTNVKGVLHVLKAVTPGMVARKQGHIIQISSIAGRDVYANGNVYCASKSALDAITRSIRLELLPHQIKVSAILPGMAETEFSLVRYEGDAEKAKKVYEGMQPLTAQDIASTIVYCIEAPEHVNIQEIVITAKAQADTRTVFRSV